MAAISSAVAGASIELADSGGGGGPSRSSRRSKLTGPGMRDGADDIEGGIPPRYDDPLQLSSRIKSPAEINAIRSNKLSSSFAPPSSTAAAAGGAATTTGTGYRNGSGSATSNLAAAAPTAPPSGSNDGRKPARRSNPLLSLGKHSVASRRLQKFYIEQNENIERLLKPVDEHVRTAREEKGETEMRYRIAVTGSFVANVLLAGLQLYASISSGSLSLWTTMADAIFDPLSNVTLIVSNRAVQRVDPRRFPSGKARIETAGNIVFCFLMTAVSFILIVVSAMQLARGSSDETRSFWLPSIIAVAVAFTTKLGLFVYCWFLREKYSQVRILWEDHRNDLFINGFGILTSIGGSKLVWWLDPVGAVLLSVLIATLWLRTAYSEFQLLIGVTADTQMLQWITYISMTHSPMIRAIDTVRAYHSGPRLVVEVDVVIDPAETLRNAHDVAEELQVKLESMPDVERAYVHIDYETSHKPEHFLKKEL